MLTFAMGFVEGESLAERVNRQGALGSRSVAKLLTDVAITMVFTSLALLGVSMVLLLRSPFRMPVGERAFRRI